MYWWKDFLIDFVTELFLFTIWKGGSYNLILIIVEKLIKMIHYELVKVIINTSTLCEVIIDSVIWHYGLPDLIITDQGLLFILKSWSSL